MTTKIRWLKTFRRPICANSTWKPLNETPETARTCDYILFEKGSETTVNVRGSDPWLISIAGIGDLMGLIEGDDFEFVDTEVEV